MPKCPRCSSEVAAAAERCPLCATPLMAASAEPSDNQKNQPQTAPDFTKVGFGAQGNVTANHDASIHTSHHTSNITHTHHEDKSQQHHVHYHGQPVPSPGARYSGSTYQVHVKLVIGVGALLAGGLFYKLGKPVAPTVPVQIHIENNPVNTVQAPTMVTPPVPLPSLPQVVEQKLEVKLNRPSYKVGETMEITVECPKAGYLYVLAVWADGRVDTLFPNSLRPDAKVAAGARIHLPQDFPPAADGRVLTYPMAMPELPGNPPRATESILAVLSPAPLDLPQSTELVSAPGFAAVGMLDDAEFRTRGPQPKFMRLQNKPRLEFGDLPQAAVHYDIYR